MRVSVPPLYIVLALNTVVLETFYVVCISFFLCYK